MRTLPLAIFMSSMLLAAGGCGLYSGDTAGPDAGATPTFYEDVAPIVYANCVDCHSDGGIAPFSLVSYDDAAKMASSMASAVESRYMPPWRADNSGECNTWQGARVLSDDDIATIVAWAKGGAPEGDPAAAPPVPHPSPPSLDHVDATLDTGVDYLPDQSLPDEYRCFITDPGIAHNSYLTAMQVKPGNPRIVHHIILYVPTSAQAEQDAIALDAADDGPGYRCFGGAGVPSTALGGWAPGVSVQRYPDGTGLLIPANRKIIVQIHYHPKPGLTDRTTVDLQLADSVQTQVRMVPISDGNLSLPPHDHAITESKTVQVPSSAGTVTLWSVFPHMHELGTSLTVTAQHNGQSKCLVDVPDWDFDWQRFYNYVKPVTVAGGSSITITCRYDNTTDQTVTWGWGTEDEMCLAYFIVTATGGTAAQLHTGPPTDTAEPAPARVPPRIDL